MPKMKYYIIKNCLFIKKNYLKIFKNILGYLVDFVATVNSFHSNADSRGQKKIRWFESSFQLLIKFMYETNFT